MSNKCIEDTCHVCGEIRAFVDGYSRVVCPRGGSGGLGRGGHCIPRMRWGRELAKLGDPQLPDRSRGVPRRQP